MSDSFSAPLQLPLRAIALAIVPETSRLDGAGWTRFFSILDTALADRPPALRRQLGLFVRLVDLLPVVLYMRPFTSLSVARRVAFLQRLQDSPVKVLRKGFWGLRTLVFMGYYGQPEVGRELGYRADAGGWSARAHRSATGGTDVPTAGPSREAPE